MRVEKGELIFEKNRDVPAERLYFFICDTKIGPTLARNFRRAK